MDRRTERDVTTAGILQLIKLPDVLSVLNALLGFSAILLVLGGVSVTERALKNALVLILLAAVVDGLDGIVARTLQKSPLGTYLDSLADMISFGLAPAIVVYVLIKDYLAVTSPRVEVVLAFCGAYVICGMLRLARFNAKAFLCGALPHDPASPVRAYKESFIKETGSSFSTGILLKKEELTNSDFVGFPITGSATFLASVILMSIELELLRSSNALFLVGLIGLLCLLMISRIRYRNLRDKRIVIPLGVVFFALFCLYLLSSKFIYLIIAVVTLTAVYICSPFISKNLNTHTINRVQYETKRK